MKPIKFTFSYILLFILLLKSFSQAMSKFAPLQNDLFLRAARGENVERVPVWIMRQAGRYLPEYRQLMRDKEFFQACRTPEIASEITLQPINRFPLDAAIIFSDILVIPQAMGMEVKMEKGSGPHFPSPLVSPADIEKLTPADQIDVNKSLGYVFEAITMTRQKLGGKVPLIGFCGAPWTLLAYMTEGSGSRLYSVAKTWLYQHTKECHQILQRITDVAVDYLVGQVLAGAQALQVFESTAGELSPDAFNEFSLPYLKQICERVKSKLTEIKRTNPELLHDESLPPIIVFAKGAHYAFGSLANSGYDAISVDWTVSPAAARQQTAFSITLQGNMDPGLLFGPEDLIRKEARRMVDGFGPQKLIGNLGHGMHPSHDPAKLGAYIDEIQKYSKALVEKQSASKEPS